MKLVDLFPENDWKKKLGTEFTSEYFLEIESFLNHEIKRGKIIFPKKIDIFNAFKFTPLSKTKVVIVGQDPYHGEGQAHGLSFSVQTGIKIPPSLKNIYKELESENIGFNIPDHGHLKSWADQGILLLNNVLTVEKSCAGSHQKKGWEKFTDKVIEVLLEKKQPIVFMLWGKPAQKKCKVLIDSHHKILESVHPSPLSAYRGFLGCNHFKKCNELLSKSGQSPINWNL